jgi:hypothetical protein
MTVLSTFVATGRALTRLARRLANDQVEFTCGQCDRNARCGLAPNQQCLYRLMQIAERRARPARWPLHPLGIR